MFKAFKIKPKDKMFDLVAVNGEFEKAILSLGELSQGAN